MTAADADACEQCVLCLQVISPGQDTRPVSRIVPGRAGNQAHQECLLRSVLGGIGHLENHAHWCVEVGDPDGGRSYRQSAVEVAAWVEAYGTDTEVARG